MQAMSAHEAIATTELCMRFTRSEDDCVGTVFGFQIAIPCNPNHQTRLLIWIALLSDHGLNVYVIRRACNSVSSIQFPDA